MSICMSCGTEHTCPAIKQLLAEWRDDQAQSRSALARQASEIAGLNTQIVYERNEIRVRQELREKAEAELAKYRAKGYPEMSRALDKRVGEVAALKAQLAEAVHIKEVQAVRLKEWEDRAHSLTRATNPQDFFRIFTDHRDSSVRQTEAARGLREIAEVVAVMPCLCQMAPDPNGKKHYDGCIVQEAIDAISTPAPSEAKDKIGNYPLTTYNAPAILRT